MRSPRPTLNYIEKGLTIELIDSDDIVPRMYFKIYGGFKLKDCLDLNMYKLKPSRKIEDTVREVNLTYELI